MKWRVLRPVGEPLPPVRHGLDPVDVLPAGYSAHLVQSGTAALALALLVAKQESAGTRKKVLLPAYGCPDLVAAVLFAGLDPELVDTTRDEPFFDLPRLEARLKDDVLAVVAVHFLGLTERVGAVEKMANRVGAIVIEDSAQRLPGTGNQAPVSDLIVLSFGRGKPAGALGGGALLVRSGTHDAVDLSGWIGSHEGPRLHPYLKRHLYNLAIRPVPYAMLARVPGLRLGETIYRPLDGIQALDPLSTATAMTTLATRSLAGRTERCTRLQAIMSSFPLVEDLAAVLDGGGKAGLTRYPVLLPARDTRDAVHRVLTKQGLGSSIMYGSALVDLPGVSVHCSEPPLAARAYADRLLTLPIHSGVRAQDFAQMAAVLTKFLG